MRRLLLAVVLLALPVSARAQVVNPFSLINFGATPVDTNSGTKTGGTLRIVFATDQPTNTNPFLVTGTGGTFPVTGTFWQATQPVSGTFWQATQPVSGTFFQATQPISATSLPLPTGASTETTLGTRLADATYTGRMPAPASPADAESNTIATLSRIGIFNFLFNGTTWDRQRGDTTNGAFVQVKTSVLPTGAALDASLTTIDTDLKANITLHAGSALIGKVGIDQTTPGTTNAVAVTNLPTTADTNTGSPGASTIRTVTADGILDCAIVTTASTNSTNCKGSAATFVGYELFNTSTTVAYLRTYNATTAPTCSSATNWIRSIPIPPAAAAGQVGGAILPVGPGVAYGTGLGYCITGGSTSTDNTNAPAGIFGVLKYR